MITFGRLHFGLRIPMEALLGGSSKVIWAQQVFSEQVAKMRRWRAAIVAAIPFAGNQATGWRALVTVGLVR